jgi:hypothetical protein
MVEQLIFGANAQAGLPFCLDTQGLFGEMQVSARQGSGVSTRFGTL